MVINDKQDMKMKKIRIPQIALAALLPLLMAGCKDFLDLKPKGRDVAETLEHYNGMLNSTNCTNIAYNVMTETGTIINSNPYWVFMSDEWITDQSVINNMGLAEQKAFKWEADIFESDDYPIEFGGLYQQIYTYNMIVDGVMDAVDGTHEEKLRVLSEARVARAFAYMLLAQFFGKPYNEATAATDLCVPLVLEASTGVNSFSRATVKDIYDFFLKELEEACPNVPEYTLHRQRIYRAAAYAMLGRAYMLVYDYDKAGTAFAEAEKLIAKSTVTLALFDYKVEMPVWKANPMWGYGMGVPINYSTANTEIVVNRQVSTTIGGSLFNRPKVFIKPEYMALFTEGDLRREFYTNNNGAYSNYRKEYRFMHNEGVDMPNFYLMYAECMARTNNLAKARELLTTLRERRFEAGFGEIPASVTTQNDLIRFAVEERLREYMGTGHRWFDMRRLWNDPLFQDLKANYTHFDGEKTYTLTEARLVYRIPPSVMVHNAGWTNND